MVPNNHQWKSKAEVLLLIWSTCSKEGYLHASDSYFNWNGFKKGFFSNLVITSSKVIGAIRPFKDALFTSWTQLATSLWKDELRVKQRHGKSDFCKQLSYFHRQQQVKFSHVTGMENCPVITMENSGQIYAILAAFRWALWFTVNTVPYWIWNANPDSNTWLPCPSCHHYIPICAGFGATRHQEKSGLYEATNFALCFQMSEWTTTQASW